MQNDLQKNSLEVAPFDPAALLRCWQQVCTKIEKAETESGLIQASDATTNVSKKSFRNPLKTQPIIYPSLKTTLLAVSKTKPAAMVATLAQAGQIHFGENYLQEAIDKMAAVEILLAPSQEDQNSIDALSVSVIWHYIGHIQRNKTRAIAESFDWVHTIERNIIAKRLHEQRPHNLPKLNVLIQVNIDDESSKSGCLPNEVDTLVDAIKTYDKLCLRGLMIIPAKVGSQSNDSKSEDDAQVGVNISAFKRTKTLFDTIAANHPELSHWDTLSMGMSADLTEAIKAGSTMVRVGSAIFGERN